MLVDLPTAAIEQVQRGALLLLHETLNDMLVEMQPKWQASDMEFATMMGWDYEEIILEPVENENFYEGYRTSLLEAPRYKYPNVACMCGQAGPGPGTELYDHQEIYRLPLVVEVMVKASPDEGETVCNKRAERMADAALMCMTRDPTLGGVVSGWITAPTVRLTELTSRKDREGTGKSQRASYGSTWYWQGARLEFAVRKEASWSRSTSTGAIEPFRTASYEGLDFDQA